MPNGAIPTSSSRAHQGRLARRADSGGIRRLRTGPGRSLGDHGGDQSRGRQLRRVPRADVQHGHAAAPRLRAAEDALPAEDRHRASCACSRWPSPSRPPAPTRPRSRPPRSATGDRYVVNGQKVWISRVQHSDLMILLARTTPLAEVKRKSEGMSIFIVDLREAIGNGMTRAADPEHGQPRNQRTLLRQSRDSRGKPDRRRGQGFQVHPRWPERRAHADRRRMHRRRLLVHRESASTYANERVVFDRPIGQNQGVQFPIARVVHRRRGRRI